MTMPHEAGILHVHVDNEVKTAPVSTEEHYAEHFTCSTFTLPQGEIIGTGVAAIEPTQILQLDPLRQRAILSCNGAGQVILAHSVQQATSLAQNVQQAADQGSLVTCPATVTVEATGPLWAVAVVAAVPAQPAVPATGVAQQNVNNYPAQVVISPNGATISAVTVNGVIVGTAAGTYIVPAYGSISVSYTVATPTWVWSNATNAVMAVGVTQERRNR